MSLSLLLLAAVVLPSRAANVAGSVVSSKEWRVKRTGATEEEFIGDVRYRSGPTIFTSDWALYKHADRNWTAKGRVRVEDLLADGNDLVADGDEALYNMGSQKGSMTGKDGITFSRTPRDEEPDHGRCDRIEWEGKEKVSSVGAVHIWGPRLDAWADRADWANREGELKLTGGRPVLLKLEGFDPTSSDWVGALQGDVVTADENPRRLAADGKSRGWLDFKAKGSAAGKQ